MEDGTLIWVSAKERCIHMFSQIQRNSVDIAPWQKSKSSPIFHRTVLEGYWELGAVMGTKMTATSCTFCSFRYISHRKQHFCEKVKKLTKFGAKTQLSLVKFWLKCWTKSGEMTLWHMPTKQSLFWFLHRARVQQKVNLSIF